MSDQWQYQTRLHLADDFAGIARRNPDDPALASLPEVLEKHRTTMKCQFDAFADYVAEAEAQGIDGYPLYTWTKATIEDPVKRAKHIKSFALTLRAE
ncbi:hypothetical protein ACFQY9_32335 [Microvirga aerilata]|jgi:hypothetical protein|uniref:hypothetical protein n=1 Tax=Microvirga aerilata TaxID=670292 RepID=UPI0028B0313D|nr:hypothetical protein [Microvirga aerilata]